MPTTSTPAAPARRPSASAGRQAKHPYSPPSRDGKVPVGGFFPPEVRTDLKRLAARDQTTQQELLEEALRLLFLQRGYRGESELAPP